jgi:hypothetical protein
MYAIVTRFCRAFKFFHLFNPVPSAFCALSAKVAGTRMDSCHFLLFDIPCRLSLRDRFSQSIRRPVSSSRRRESFNSSALWASR